MALQEALSDSTRRVVNNQEAQALDPYEEMIMRALVSALRTFKSLTESGQGRIKLPQRDGLYSFPRQWAEGGWLPLDRDGREYLQVLGFGGADLKTAINAGIRAGLILRKIRGGVSRIGLSEVAVRR